VGFNVIKPGDNDPVMAGFEQEGYLVEFVHIASGKTCVFPAWITDFSDSYTSDWSTEKIFGRNDPIGSFSGTSRRISLGMNIPSFSVEEARQNLHQLEHLIAHLYPSYTTTDGVDTMSGYPLVKVKFGNLIKNARFRNNALNALKGGLTCWMDSVTFTPDLEAGFHHPSPEMSNADIEAYNTPYSVRQHAEGNGTLNRSHTFIPKTFQFSTTLNVVHEHKLGWRKQTWLGGVDPKAPGASAYPYGMEVLTGRVHYTAAGKGDNHPTLRTKVPPKEGEPTARELMKIYNNVLGEL